MGKLTTKLVLRESKKTQFECNKCEKIGHRFNSILVISRNDQIRDAKYCICCGEILK